MFLLLVSLFGFPNLGSYSLEKLEKCRYNYIPGRFRSIDPRVLLRQFLQPFLPYEIPCMRWLSNGRRPNQGMPVRYTGPVDLLGLSRSVVSDSTTFFGWTVLLFIVNVRSSGALRYSDYWTPIETLCCPQCHSSYGSSQRRNRSSKRHR